MVSKVLSLRILIGKFALLMAGLAFGGSMGKEGPMVTLSASAMVLTLRFVLALPKAKEQFAPNLNTYTRTAIIAGSGAGIAAAFNSITGGIMFAIEEVRVTKRKKHREIKTAREGSATRHQCHHH